MFELTIVMRDHLGNPKGTRSFVTNEASRLAEWYFKNRHRNIKRKKKNEKV
jgi:hypothetical protein